MKFWPPKGHLRTRSVSKVAFGSSTGVFRGHFCATLVIWVPSKLPAANSRSGSTEGHGASGDLFAMRGAFGRVRVFFEIESEKVR